uniref:J domain-containing protein n=1 Tax=Alexandrium andersonii TaxID=327968 RepID=A0A7S2I296_9DINO|mmetsp:Transcript_77736/g.173984  ORF Transcript_77736/g.173984 Transcript_77736/m.173984 type:complete len:188 (+) Transcript_77736:139-702(+)
MAGEPHPVLDSSLIDEMSIGGLLDESVRLEESVLIRRVEGMIASMLGRHPDADVLVPLALLEVATDENHRSALEAVVDDPHCFREYVFGMVSAVVPPEAPDEVALDDEAQRPCSPGHRRRICNQVSARLDESSEELGRVPRAEVRKAYLQLAKHYHPDKGGDKDMFVTLQTAYEMLQRTDSQGSNAV